MFVEIFPSGANGITHSGWGTPVAVDPGFDAEPLLAIGFGDVTAWDGHKLEINSQVRGELMALAEEWMDLRKEDWRNNPPVLRLDLRGSEYWGWVHFHVMESASHTPLLTFESGWPDRMWLEAWGTRTGDGQDVIEAAREEWLAKRG